MMDWLHSCDVSIFRFCNSSASNSLFDSIMPWVSTSPWVQTILLTVGVLLAWRGGVRGRICAMMLILSLCLGNWLVVDSIKHAVARVRPFNVLADVHLRVGAGYSYSMPSSHAANWFSAATVLFLYYRRSGWVMFPMAVLVSFSRVYNGVHFPTDVAAGALLGAGYSVAIVYLCDAFWSWAGPRWFAWWHRQMPSLIRPVVSPAQSDDPSERDLQWKYLAFVLVAVLLLLRLCYLGAGKIQLSEDEAYQWLWSKHPALSYYSKPPLIAYTQFIGTHLWGDTQLGVRFFSPIITAVLSILLIRFISRWASGKAAFMLVVITSSAILLSLGSVLMTVDPLSVLFWTGAMIIGWRASSPEGTTRDWLWTGLWMGLGLLSKYTNLVQFACWALFFILWPPARAHLRKAGPWLALLVVGLCSLPVLIWLGQNHWITVTHVASDGQLGEKWHRTYTLEFLLTEAGVLNPVFFIGALWAAIAFWKQGRRDPLQLYLFSMGAPVFLMYFLLSFHSRVLPNWIAPSVIPLYCLMVIYWRTRWGRWVKILRPTLAIGAGLGAFVVLLAHDTNLFNKLFHRALPARVDPLHRVHGWDTLASVVDAERMKLATPEHDAFILCEHYGFTSQISFYLPEAKRRILNDPLVYYYRTTQPDNQFYYWPNYLGRTGQNAVFVREVEKPKFQPGWFSKWWNHGTDLYLSETPVLAPAPPEIVQRFESVTNLGVRDVVYNNTVVRRVQLFACRNLR